MKSNPWKIQAKWIVPVSGPPIENGIVEANDGRIVDVRKKDNDSDALDLGQVAVLPGLINCHTHLEFSDLLQPLGSAGNPITSWIPEVIENRISKGSSAEIHENAIRQGLEACRQTGTVAIGEISTRVDCFQPYAESELAGTVFLERLGNSPVAAEPIIADARKFVEHQQPPTKNSSLTQWHKALSPHASYSVSPMLLDGLIDAAKNFRVPLAMHLAESREEREWMEHRSGPFVELLESLNAFPQSLDSSWNIETILENLSRVDRSLVVHGNYLADQELDLIANHADRMTVVYCPRTHAYFGHDPYPLEKLLARGIRVALGTDSLASNPDLNLWEEARHIAKMFPQIPADEPIRFVTSNAALALGWRDDYGTIEPGKRASLISIECRGDRDPLREILDADQGVCQHVSIP